MENITPEISIDKMVIVGYDTGGFSDRVSESTWEYIDNMTGAAYPYDRAWHCRDGSYIQFSTSDKHKDIRLEFNPNKCEKENVIKILNCMKYGSINRTDIALDFYGEDLSKYFILDHQARKYSEYKTASGQLETRYFGSSKSDLQLIMYDKAKEQGVEGHWWRFEARLTGEWTKTINGDKKRSDGVYKPYMGNPFTGIQVNIPSPEYQGMKFQEKAIISALLSQPGALAELPKSSRLKYKKILANLGADKDLLLEHHFQKNYSEIMYMIQKWRKEANKNNTINLTQL